MLKTVTLEKEIGETPLRALEKWRAAHPEYAGVPASYAGRLDPMASGKLLILLGEECKRQADYIGLDKEYEIEVLLDVGSDTGDALGLVEASRQALHPDVHALTSVLEHEVGTKTLPYPVFSSKTVAGKPLFLYALENKLTEIEIPTHEETIHSIELTKISLVSGDALSERIQAFLAKVPTTKEPSKLLGADFRIDAVRESWKEILTKERAYTILALRVSCGSGTYMRSLASRIGEALGTRALALSIHRTKIG